MNLISTQNKQWGLVLKDGSLFTPDNDFMDLMCQAYPNIDIPAEFRKMAAWCVSNESQRKTKRGIKKFINGWLNRAKPPTGKTGGFMERHTDRSWADDI